MLFLLRQYTKNQTMMLVML